MAVSMIGQSINSLLTKLASIPFNWDAYLNGISGGNIPTTSMPDNTKLYQNLALWNNQPRQWMNGKGFPNSKPCVYVEPVFGRSMNMGLGITFYPDFIYRIHIIDFQVDGFNEAGGADGDNIRIGGLDQNMEIFTFRDLTKTNLELFFPKYCGAMTNSDERVDDEHAAIYHYILDFKCAFSDLKGGPLDPDQDKVISIAPPHNLIMTMGFSDGGDDPVDPRTSYIWQVCEIRAVIVTTPDPDNTQTLCNGVVIPVEYALNNDGYSIWVADTSYDIGDHVNIGTTGYECIEANNDAIFDPDKWTEIAPSYPTLTIPYLITTAGIQVLTPFIIDNSIIQDIVYSITTGTFDNSANAGFVLDNNISFNASIPMLGNN